MSIAQTSRLPDERAATMGTWCFAAVCPKLWNSLLAALRHADISFKQLNGY